MQVSDIYSRLGEFSDWWMSEISLLIDTVLDKRNCVDITVDLTRKVDALEDALQNSAAKRCGYTFILPDSYFLKKKINLPADALKTLGRVLEYEFSRYFPMDIHDVVYSHTVNHIIDGKAEITIVALPVSKLGDLEAILHENADFSPAYLLCADKSNDIHIDCTLQLTKSSKDGTARKGIWNRAVLISVLVMFLLGLPFAKISIDNLRIKNDITSLRKELAAVIDEYNILRSAEKLIDQVISRKENEASPLKILHALSQSLHGVAVINTIHIDKARIKLEGVTVDKNKALEQLDKVSVKESLKFEVMGTRLKRLPFRAEFSYAKD